MNNIKEKDVIKVKITGIQKYGAFANADEFDYKFINNVKKAFVLLLKNAEIKEYMKRYSEYIDEYRRFFKE